ncbi:hypothetical protein D8674_018953 [Pyrus ussuriensis x Pyrus communis]|uniref:Uncharacterized protein n=1 Tax=Pyrus ussuriensis x Pyrus communis TaxID=2448454 RepID=A0A5N5GAZ1_9ROSA|nr:hypothetical protein D8674_018953 [Pyrus ussuriensis x Pyrus communis]
MSSFDRKSDEYLPPWYSQSGSSVKVGYFKAAHININFDELFQAFLKAYKHVIPSEVCVKRVKDDSDHEPCGRFSWNVLSARWSVEPTSNAH